MRDEIQVKMQEILLVELRRFDIHWTLYERDTPIPGRARAFQSLILFVSKIALRGDKNKKSKQRVPQS
jgi:hypothetical protein